VLLARRQNKRAIAELQEVAREIAEVVGTRWREGDARDDAMVKMTRRVTQLTWALLLLGLGTLAVGIAAIV
jgi:hypothetical protein